MANSSEMDDTTKPDFAAADRDAPLMAASKSGAYYDDERNLARAYLASRAELATVQAERDARADALKEWDDRVGALQAELATLRETLVGEVEAHLLAHSDSCPAGFTPTVNCLCGARPFNQGLDRAITIIKGTP